MPHRSEGPRCLVLGGTGYVGAAVCRLLHSRGARVAFTWRTGEDAALELNETLGLLPFRVDLADYAATRAAVRSAIAGLEGLDALIQCAGIAGASYEGAQRDVSLRERFLETTGSDLDQMFDLTVRSTFAACQEAAVPLQAAGGGNIVIVGSVDGIKPLPAPVHYASSKGALKSLAESLAKALGGDDIRVNLVAPGLLEGGVGRRLKPALVEAYLAHCALRRLGTAEEVAEVVAWLALENTYLTAQAVPLDGGL